MLKDVLLVLAGALAPLITLVLQQRAEQKRLSIQTREARLNELIDRLQHDRQFIRSSAVEGIGDLAISALHKVAPDFMLYRRAMSQLAVALHTEVDGAVLETLSNAIHRVALQLRDLNTTADWEVAELRHSCACARRWLRSATVHIPARHGEEFYAANKMAIENFVENYYGLRRELLQEVMDEGRSMGMPEWQELIVQTDTAPSRRGAIWHFGNCVARYQVACRTLRAVEDALRIGPSATSNDLVSPETRFRGGVLDPTIAFIPLSDASK